MEIPQFFLEHPCKFHFFITALEFAHVFPWNLYVLNSTCFFFSGITPSSGVAFGTVDSSATWGCLAGAGEKNTWLAKFHNYPYTINLPGLVLLLFLLNVLLSSILGFPILHSE